MSLDLSKGITVEETANRIGYSESYLRKLISKRCRLEEEGKLEEAAEICPKFYRGAKTVFMPRDVEKWIKGEI